MSNEAAFVMGQPIICVDDEGGEKSWMGINHFPIRGTSYTVEGFHACAGGEMGVVLAEISGRDEKPKALTFTFRQSRFVAA